MLSCPWSIWDSFHGIQSHTHNWSFGWITIKIHNKIKYLKVPTYDLAEKKESDVYLIASAMDIRREDAATILRNLASYGFVQELIGMGQVSLRYSADKDHIATPTEPKTKPQ